MPSLSKRKPHGNTPQPDLSPVPLPIQALGLREWHTAPLVSPSHPCEPVASSHRADPAAAWREYPRHQVNPENCRAALIFDVDHPGVNFAADAPPSWIVTNRRNRHSHVAFILKDPIHYNFDPHTGALQSRKHPIEYAAAVEKLICNTLGADLGFTCVLTRSPYYHSHPPPAPDVRQPAILDNPISPRDGCITYYPLGAYHAGFTMQELVAAYGPLQPRRPLRERDYATLSALGRNCALFDIARREAYKPKTARAILDGGSIFAFVQANNAALAASGDFAAALPAAEERSIAKSIDKYIRRRNGSAGYSETQRRRQQQQVAARRSKNEQRDRIIHELRCVGGWTLQNTARAVKLTPSWVRRVARDCRLCSQK